MPDIILDILAAGFLAVFTHEGGHYLAALCFGEKLKFRFEWGRLFGVVPVPRGVWDMPVMASWKQRVTALAGFGTEFVCAAVATSCGWPWLLLVAACHIIAYPFYAGDSSDFKWL